MREVNQEVRAIYDEMRARGAAEDCARMATIVAVARRFGFTREMVETRVNSILSGDRNPAVPPFIA